MSGSDYILSDLNPQQLAAVQTATGPLLVVAGAGSGKTSALTRRIAWLIQTRQAYPDQILAVTFTNKAANEMKERIKKLLSRGQGFDSEHQAEISSRGQDLALEFDQSQGGNLPTANHQLPTVLPTVGTFHSVCVQILRREIHQIGRERDFTIYDTADQKAVMRQIFAELGIDPKEYNPMAVLSAISWAKNHLVGPESYQADSHFTEKVAAIYPRYAAYLQKNNGLDFDDLLGLTVQLFREHESVLSNYQERWRYICVDEYQDTNYAQAELTNLLAAKYRNLCVIGDPDQSIYSWRGADISNIRDFKKKYPETKIVTLEQNYRSTKVILAAANAAISRNKNREEKNLWTAGVEGEKILRLQLPDERIEAEFVAQQIQTMLTSTPATAQSYRDFVVLYRTNAQSRVFEEVFLRHGLPHRIIGGVKFYERKEVKDVVAYLRLIANPADNLALLRIINVPSRKLGPRTLELMQEFAQQRGGTLWSAIEHAYELPIPASKQEVLVKFGAGIERLRQLNRSEKASGLIKQLIQFAKLRDHWNLDGTAEGEARYENVQELVSVASKYDALEPGISLATFLEEIALLSDADQLDAENSITLMTLHTAKGLEYPIVFLVGLEQNIFPHSRSLLDPRQMEEERRLFYVGLTRAKQRLFLLSARQRMFFGETQYNAPSEFLEYIPSELLAAESQVELARRGYGSRALPDEAETVVDFGASRATSGYSAGDRVTHAVFGEGVILNITGGLADIRFGSSVKRFALSIAPLTKLD